MKTPSKFYNVYPEGTVDFIKENYGRYSASKLAKELNLSTDQVKYIIKSRNIHHSNKELRYQSREVRAYKQKFSSYRCGAQSRSYTFTISLEEFTELVKEDCFYCGSKPRKVTPRKREKGLPTTSIDFNGIDRIDNKKGYVDGNCVPCCSLCNEMKMDRSLHEFINHVEKIAAHFTPRVIKQEIMAEPIRKKK